MALVTASAEDWLLFSHVLFPGRSIDVQLESRQFITSSCITSHTLLSTWNRRVEHAPCFLVDAANAVHGSSLELMTSLLVIKKKGWLGLQDLAMSMNLCG